MIFYLPLIERRPSDFDEFWSGKLHQEKEKKTLIFEPYNLMDLMEWRIITCLGLNLSKITLRSYGYFLKFTFFFPKMNYFFDYVKKLLNFAKKTQRILEIKYNYCLAHLCMTFYFGTGTHDENIVCRVHSTLYKRLWFKIWSKFYADQTRSYNYSNSTQIPNCFDLNHILYAY